MDPTTGRVIGSDVAGIVDKAGADLTDCMFGDRAAGLLQGATLSNSRPSIFADYAILEADLSINVSFEEVATLPLCALTVAQALCIRLRINAPFPIRTSFLPNLSQSPQSLSTQPPLRSGYTLWNSPNCTPYQIIATANPEHHINLLALSVSAVFDYRSPSWEDVLVATKEEGVAYAFDCISEDDIPKGRWHHRRYTVDGRRRGMRRVYETT